MIKEVEEKFGLIYILVNNVGIINDKFVMWMDVEDFKKCFDINLIGIFNMM